MSARPWRVEFRYHTQTEWRYVSSCASAEGATKAARREAHMGFVARIVNKTTAEVIHIGSDS
jgi:hypothetical protein